jgi:hypothetical protein
MKPFSKYIVKDVNTIDNIMHSTIGASWDYIPDKEKYPKRYPALLIIDEDNKNIDYVYPNIFRETEMKYIWLYKE